VINLKKGKLYKLKKDAFNFGRLERSVGSNSNTERFAYFGKVPKGTILLCVGAPEKRNNGEQDMLMAQFLVEDRVLHLMLFREDLERTHGFPDEIANHFIETHLESLEKL